MSRRRRIKRSMPELTGRAQGSRQPSELVEAAQGDPDHPIHHLRRSHPVYFLSVVSSFLGLGEYMGIELPTIGEKLAEMAQWPSVVDNAMIVALAELAPMADDRVHASTLAAAMRDEDRRELPPWLFELANARPVGGARTTGDWEGRAIWMLGFEVGGHRLTTMLGIDDELGFAAGAACTSECGLTEMTCLMLELGSEQAGVEAVDPAEVGDRMRRALVRSDELSIAPAVSFWPEPRALIEWSARVACASRV